MFKTLKETIETKQFSIGVEKSNDSMYVQAVHYNYDIYKESDGNKLVIPLQTISIDFKNILSEFSKIKKFDFRFKFPVWFKINNFICLTSFKNNDDRCKISAYIFN